MLQEAPSTFFHHEGNMKALSSYIGWKEKNSYALEKRYAGCYLPFGSLRLKFSSSTFPGIRRFSKRVNIPISSNFYPQLGAMIPHLLGS